MDGTCTICALVQAITHRFCHGGGGGGGMPTYNTARCTPSSRGIRQPHTHTHTHTHTHSVQVTRGANTTGRTTSVGTRRASRQGTGHQNNIIRP